MERSVAVPALGRKGEWGEEVEGREFGRDAQVRDG